MTHPLEYGIATIFNIEKNKLMDDGTRNSFQDLSCIPIQSFLKELQTEHTSIFRRYPDLSIPELNVLLFPALEENRKIMASAEIKNISNAPIDVDFGLLDSPLPTLPGESISLRNTDFSKKLANETTFYEFAAIIIEKAFFTGELELILDQQHFPSAKKSVVLGANKTYANALMMLYAFVLRALIDTSDETRNCCSILETHYVRLLSGSKLYFLFLSDDDDRECLIYPTNRNFVDLPKGVEYISYLGRLPAYADDVVCTFDEPIIDLSNKANKMKHLIDYITMIYHEYASLDRNKYMSCMNAGLKYLAIPFYNISDIVSTYQSDVEQLILNNTAENKKSRTDQFIAQLKMMLSEIKNTSSVGVGDSLRSVSRLERVKNFTRSETLAAIYDEKIKPILKIDDNILEEMKGYYKNMDVDDLLNAITSALNQIANSYGVSPTASSK